LSTLGSGRSPGLNAVAVDFDQAVDEHPIQSVAGFWLRQRSRKLGQAVELSLEETRDFGDVRAAIQFLAGLLAPDEVLDGRPNRGVIDHPLHQLVELDGDDAVASLDPEARVDDANPVLPLNTVQLGLDLASHAHLADAGTDSKVRSNPMR